MKNCKLVSFCSFFVTMSLLETPAEARVTRIDVTTRQVVADGVAFGETGPYEKLRGTVYFEVDPFNPHNAVVFDVDKAPRNRDGMVEFSADFYILKPVDLTKGNGGLFLDVENKGRKICIVALNDVFGGANFNDPTTLRDFGNGFLLRQGYVLAWVGQDVSNQPGMDRLTVQFPIAMEDKEPITELILTEFADGDGAGGVPFTSPLRFETISQDQIVSQAELRMRPSDSFRPPIPDIPEGEVIPQDQWSFARCPNGPPGTPSTRDICLASRFQNNMVYQLIYKATKSPVVGLGFVTTRDFVSFLRYATNDDAGNPNPVPGLPRVIGYGLSESGKYLRDFLYQGFNEDAEGQRVFDGVWIHVIGARKPMLNYRFGAPAPGARHHAGRFKPEDSFPRTYAVRTDPLTGNMDGILKRLDSDPKVIHTDSANEYWLAWSSLVDTDEDGLVDLDHPSNVRRYFFSSTQHSSGKGARADYGVANRQCQQLSNVTNNGILARPLLVALDQWIRQGTEPPASRVPRIDNGTLVPPDQYCRQFPSIPGVTCNGLFNASGGRYFGPRVQSNRGVIDNLIPQVLSEHRVLVPKADEIGNDIAGIRHPFVEAPIATLTGWNLRRAEFTDGDLCELNGMTIPLPKTPAQRIETGDPRTSLVELYGDHTGYVLKVADAALNLWSQRLMLLEDVFQTIQEADDSDVLR